MPRYNPALYWGLMRALHTNYHQVTNIIRHEEPKQLKYNTGGLSKENLSLWKSAKPSPETVQNKASKVSKANDDKQYYIEIYITSTSVENGPGHISASIIKETDAGAELEMHTSYVPGTIGSIINGVTLTNIPVPAVNVPDIRDDDINKANLIIRVPITEEQFKKGLEKQRAIEKGVKEGTHLYATTGPTNLMALFVTWMFSQQKGSDKMIKKYKEDTGFYPDEDLSGNLIIPDSHYPENYKPYVLLNCTAAIQDVLKDMGLVLRERFMLPASLGECVLNECQQATIVQNSLVAPKAAVQTENDETTALYRRSLD